MRDYDSICGHPFEGKRWVECNERAAEIAQEIIAECTSIAQVEVMLGWIADFVKASPLTFRDNSPQSR